MNAVLKTNLNHVTFTQVHWQRINQWNLKTFRNL